MMFEYIAGLYINKLLSSFPCFIKTERLFMLDIDEFAGYHTYPPTHAPVVYQPPYHHYR